MGIAGGQGSLDSSHGAVRAQLQEAPVRAISAADDAVPEPPREALPSLASLTRTHPSPLLRWQLLEILYAYCCTLRTFHGDWHEEPQVSAPVLRQAPLL